MKKKMQLIKHNKAGDCSIEELNSLSLSHFLLNNFFKKTKTPVSDKEGGVFVFITP